VAWGVPKIGALATPVTSGNLTLAEPAGIAAGDLMVACIAYRSNAAFTVPGDWNLVATQQSSGDIDATNGIASGLMMWCVRGGSAPTLTFNRTGGDVASGRIIAYEGGHASAPFDTGTANTLGAASATVTTGTLTTAEAGELIVAMVSCGDNLTTSAFDAATDPTTASGATDTTTAPTAGTWLERADDGSNTGADWGMAIADAIRATAGATGTIQATVSASARHVMIAAAFKLSPAVTVTPALGALTATGFAPTVTASGGPPAFQSAITIAGVDTGTADLVVPLPAHAADDIALIHLFTFNAALASLSATGWTQIATWDQTEIANEHRHWLFGRRLASGSDTDPTFTRTDTTGAIFAAGATYRGATDTGTAWEVVGTGTGFGDTEPCVLPGITTVTAQSLVVVSMGHADNVATTATVSGTDPSSYTVHFQTTLLAFDATILIAEGARATAGATGDITVDFDAAFPAGRGAGGIAVALAPIVSNVTATPGVGALTATGFAPAVTASNHQTVTAGLGALTLTGFAPSAQTALTVTPALGELTAAGFAPTVTATANTFARPALGELAAAGFAPTVSATANVTVTPALGVLAATGFAPTVSTPVTVSPALGELAATGFAPTATVAVQASTVTGAAALTGFAPTVVTPVTVTAALGQLVVTGFAPTVTAVADTRATPGTGLLAATGAAPTVSATAHVTATPGTGVGVLAGLAPTIAVPVTVAPALGALTATGFAPVVTVSVQATTATGEAVLAGFAPTVQTPVTVTSGLGLLAATGYEPTVLAPVTVVSATGELDATGFAPVAEVTANVLLHIGLGVVEAVGYAPDIERTGGTLVDVLTGELVAVGYEPQMIVPGGPEPERPRTISVPLDDYVAQVERSGLSDAARRRHLPRGSRRGLSG
jgi:hypothetical protein